MPIAHHVAFLLTYPYHLLMGKEALYCIQPVIPVQKQELEIQAGT